MCAKKKKESRLLVHLKSIGFTNRLAIYSLMFLFISIILGFILAMFSVIKSYTAALLVYTACVGPIGSLISISIGRTVEKSRAENCANGIVYETAMMNISNSDKSNDETVPDDFAIMPDDEDLSVDETTM